MAIIITIMVIDIPLPEVYTPEALSKMLYAIFIFFVSFLIVGAQWHKHHFLFSRLTKATGKVIWRNLLFLFFLSLVPLFTKWVLADPESVIPVIAYDGLFILLNVSFQFLWNCIRLDKEALQQAGFSEMTERKRRILPFLIMCAVFFGIIGFSFIYPTVSIVFFIGFPVVLSLLNLFLDDAQRGGRKSGKRQKTKMRVKQNGGLK
jgi:uncharacterized membrane protein